MTTNEERLDNMVTIAVNALEDVKAKDIVVLDVHQHTTLFSRIIVATGDSSRQVRALGRNVEEELKSSGYEILSVEGLQNNEWILVDAGELIIHTMQPDIRKFYSIETLWGAEKPEQLDVMISKIY
ncbi:MAG: ribosome silencing factor [Neisseriaceae bacterium]|nr:MAG: ribosome silencing factor [Neisseriaceae bacterium]